MWTREWTKYIMWVEEEKNKTYVQESGEISCKGLKEGARDLLKSKSSYT